MCFYNRDFFFEVLEEFLMRTIIKNVVIKVLDKASKNLKLVLSNLVINVFVYFARLQGQNTLNVFNITAMFVVVVKSRRMGWAGHVARMGEERNCTRIWWENPKERDHLEDQGVCGKMGSEWILGRLAWGVWIGFDWLRTETGGVLL
jgi:hypothetical protein